MKIPPVWVFRPPELGPGIARNPRVGAPVTANFGQIWRSSYYPRGFVAPIAVAQQPLVELAGRQPRQFVLEIDRTRHLLARQRLAAEQNQLLGQVGAGRNSRHG